jgi:hypothetical protein
MRTMIHGDFKPGEVCRTAGVYECRTCKGRSRASSVSVEQGQAFPECASCKERGALEVDTIWKLLQGR